MPQDEFELDDIDRGILQLLQQDARNATVTSIGEALGIAHSTVSTRIDALEDRGVIQGYTVTLDLDRAGVNPTMLVVCDVPATEREALAETVIDLEGVTGVRTVLAGTRNLHATVVGREVRELSRACQRIEETGADIVDTGVVKVQYRQPFDHFGTDPL